METAGNTVIEIVPPFPVVVAVVGRATVVSVVVRIVVGGSHTRATIRDAHCRQNCRQTARNSVLRTAFVLVVLREALSSQNNPLAKLISLSRDRRLIEVEPAFPRVNGVDPRLYQMNRQLSPAERSELVELYRSGKNTYELARQFGIHRVTVSRMLRHAGVEMRNQGLSAKQIDDAAKLYEEGNSLTRIGVHFSVDHGTVWRQLRKRGVKMRDTHGRPT
jgi:hypothetical protein